MSQAQATTPKNPRVGILAIVRMRRAVVNEVRPFDGQDGVLHLVRLDYKDDSRPETEEVIWELEPARRLLEPNELPRASNTPMPAKDFDALLRSARWTAISPYLDPEADGPIRRMPISSSFHGFGEDSELCKMLRMIAPYFEHRLFLTATPHNGHTRCFSGLLELLDPVRFTRTDELKPADGPRGPRLPTP